MNSGNSSTSQNLLLEALKKIMRPLVRLALSRRIQFQLMSDLLKQLYVSVAEREFDLETKRITDSRLSILTGLQRKDIKAIRSREAETGIRTLEVGPIPRVLTHWQNTVGYQDKDRRVLSLPKTGNAPSFESLVSLVSRDIHPRTMLDDMMELGIINIKDDLLVLNADAFLPREDEEALLSYYANNLADHVTAASANVQIAPEAAPNFERAVHYNNLSDEALNELDALSRRLQMQALTKINERAHALQMRDREDLTATGRFRCGAFVFRQSSNDDE